MISKQKGKSPSIPWRAGLMASIFVSAGIGLFSLSCKHPAQVLSKLSAKLPTLSEPAVAHTLSPAIPSLSIAPKLAQKMTVLLMGVDSNGLKNDPFLGTRSDTMMLVSIDPVTNKVGVVSIPRDSRVRVPNHGIDKINSAHAFGGPQLSMQAVREAFGVPVDHYIEVDTGGLKKLFEILGPVEVLVEKEMHYVDHSAKLNVDLHPGLQLLSPEQAEQYVRFRHDARGDIGRIERQQWFVRQAAKKFKEPQIVLKLPELVTLGYQCVRTDLPLQDVLAIALFAKDFPQEKVVTAMLPGDARWISGGSYWVPDMTAGQAMFSRILGCSIQIPELSPGSSAAGTALESTGSRDTLAATAVAADNAQQSGAALTASPVSVAQSCSSELSSGRVSAPATGEPFSSRAQQQSWTQAAANSAAAPVPVIDYTKPPTVAIKYPRGCEELSKAISQQLSQAGFRVKYRWQIAASDCQHELLLQQSLRANDEATNKICQTIPELQNFSLSMALEARPSTDFTIVISPDSQMPSICHSNLALPVFQQKPLPLNISVGAAPLLPQE